MQRHFKTKTFTNDDRLWERCDPSSVRAVDRITAEEVDSEVIFGAAADAGICDGPALTIVRECRRCRRTSTVRTGHLSGHRNGTTILATNIHIIIIISTTTRHGSSSSSRRIGIQFRRVRFPIGPCHHGRTNLLKPQPLW